MKTLTFNDTQLAVIEHEGKEWMTASDISKALGYEKSTAVTDLYNRNREELDEMTCILNLRIQGQVRKTRVFDRDGSWTIGMFANTDTAKDFRKWVRSVLAKEITLPSPIQPHIAPQKPVQHDNEEVLLNLLEKQTSALEAISERLGLLCAVDRRSPRAWGLADIILSDVIHECSRVTPYARCTMVKISGNQRKLEVA